MKVPEQGVPLDTLIAVVKESVRRAGISRTSQDRDLQVTSVQLILDVVAASAAGSSVDFRVPFIGMQLKLGTKVTKTDTHTIDITLVPSAKLATRQVRGGQEVEDALVSAIADIRTVTASAADGDDPWVMSEATVDISFAITKTGTITLGVDGDLSGELTHTLRLRLAAP